jgi:uncharacterized protein YxeA
MGVNVEGDLEAEEILHNFALSKDENKSNDRNIVLTIKIVKGMKKMFFALVAMVMMTMSANAQSNDNYDKLTVDRLASYLELTINQMEPVKTAMAQFESSMQAYYQLQDASKAVETWEKIQARHKLTMKKILSDKQYDKYVKTLDLTVKNTADRMLQEAMAQK